MIFSVKNTLAFPPELQSTPHKRFFNPGLSTRCKKCRYDKCLKFGMDPKWVLTRSQSYKTALAVSLTWLISWVFVSGKPSQFDPIFVSKARSLPCRRGPCLPLALLSNKRQVLKGSPRTYALAYLAPSVTKKKTFITLTTTSLHILHHHWHAK